MYLPRFMSFVLFQLIISIDHSLNHQQQQELFKCLEIIAAIVTSPTFHKRSKYSLTYLMAAENENSSSLWFSVFLRKKQRKKDSWEMSHLLLKINLLGHSRIQPPAEIFKMSKICLPKKKKKKKSYSFTLSHFFTFFS